MILFSKETTVNAGQWELDSDAVAAIDFNVERVYFPQFRLFLRFRRCSLTKDRCRVLFNALCQVRDRADAVRLLEDAGSGITREQWQNLYQYVNVEIFLNPQYAVEFALKESTDKVRFNLILGDDSMYRPDGWVIGCCRRWFLQPDTVGDRRGCPCCFELTQKIFFMWLRLRAMLYSFFTHVWIAR